MKRVLLLIIGFFALVSAAEAKLSEGRGFYVGPELGYGVTKGSISVIETANTRLVHSGRVGGDGFLYGLLLGWGHQAECLYASIEASAQGDTTDFETVNRVNPGFVADSLRVRHKSSYGLALRAGYVVPSRDILFFVSLGGKRSSWTTSYKASLSPQTFNMNVNKSDFVFVPGIGVEGKVHKSFTLRGTWSYAFPVKSFMSIPAIPFNPDFENAQVRSSLSQAMFTLAALWHF